MTLRAIAERSLRGVFSRGEVSLANGAPLVLRPCGPRMPYWDLQRPSAPEAPPPER